MPLSAETSKTGRPRAGTWRRGYVFFVLSLVHALALLFLLELAARALFSVRESLTSTSPDAEVLAAYPDRDEEEVRALLAETWESPWRHEPWVGFRETPRRGRFVNISEQGFRFSTKEERDLGAPGRDVFVFGGSTTFGYGVADLETIPARIQSRLAERGQDAFRIFNFGRGYYYSAQELALFQDLLRRGFVPEMAIFLDGLNEGQPAPFFSAEMARLFAASNESPRRLAGLGLSALWQRSALNRVLQGVARRLGVGAGESTGQGAGENRGASSFGGLDATPEQVRDGYLENRRLIEAAARAHGVRTFFFIQPVPGYRNAFGDHALMRHPQSPATAPRMRLLEGTTDGQTSLSLAGTLEGFEGRPFVDSFHYSPEANDLLARRVLEHVERVLATETSPRDHDRRGPDGL